MSTTITPDTRFNLPTGMAWERMDDGDYFLHNDGAALAQVWRKGPKDWYVESMMAGMSGDRFTSQAETREEVMGMGEAYAHAWLSSVGHYESSSDADELANEMMERAAHVERKAEEYLNRAYAAENELRELKLQLAIHKPRLTLVAKAA